MERYTMSVNHVAKLKVSPSAMSIYDICMGIQIMNFAVYTLIYPHSGQVYVGSTSDVKARYKRHLDELRLGTHHNATMSELYRSNYIPMPGYIIPCNTRDEAYALEVDMIKFNFEPDIVLNILIGGQGGDAMSRNPNKDDIILRRAKTQREIIAAMTPEERKAKYGKPGELNGMYGRSHTEETKSILRQVNLDVSPPNKGIAMDTARYAKHMEAMANRDIAGEKNPFYGKSHSEDTRKKISKAAMGRPSARRKSISIDGTSYPSYQHASNVLGIPVVTIRYRCLSENPKFINWKLL